MRARYEELEDRERRRPMNVSQATLHFAIGSVCDMCDMSFIWLISLLLVEVIRRRKKRGVGTFFYLMKGLKQSEKVRHAFCCGHAH